MSVGRSLRIDKGHIPARFAAAVLADPEFGRTFTLEGLQDVKIPI